MVLVIERSVVPGNVNVNFVKINITLEGANQVKVNILAFDKRVWISSSVVCVQGEDTLVIITLIPLYFCTVSHHILTGKN